MINGGDAKGPLAGLLGHLTVDKDDGKTTPLEFIGGLIGGAINGFSNGSPFFNGGWNNQGGISFPGRPSDISVVLSGLSRFCFASFYSSSSFDPLFFCAAFVCFVAIPPVLPCCVFW